jgi:hypothetical protein
MLVDLRARVDQANAENEGPGDGTRVVVYAGQCIIGEQDDEAPTVD